MACLLNHLEPSIFGTVIAVTNAFHPSGPGKMVKPEMKIKYNSQQY